MTRFEEDLFGAVPGRPEGLGFAPDLIDREEEQGLIRELQRLPFRPFQFQNWVGKRETVSFGWTYRFDGSGLARAEPLPDWLLPVRTRAAGFAGLEPDRLEQALLIRYGKGAGLGWHRDRPVFGNVLGLSLLSPAPLRFRRRAGPKWDRFTLCAIPRSLYWLCGPARWEWEHGVPPVEALRYSITFRTLKAIGDKAKTLADQE